MDTHGDAGQVPVLSACGGQSEVPWLPGPCSISTGLWLGELGCAKVGCAGWPGEMVFLPGQGWALFITRDV